MCQIANIKSLEVIVNYKCHVSYINVEILRYVDILGENAKMYLCGAGSISTSLVLTGVDSFDLCLKIRHIIYK